MTNRYIVIERHQHIDVPRCDLYGSPYPSRKAAMKAAKRLAVPTIIKTVKRCL